MNGWRTMLKALLTTLGCLAAAAQPVTDLPANTQTNVAGLCRLIEVTPAGMPPAVFIRRGGGPEQLIATARDPRAPERFTELAAGDVLETIAGGTATLELPAGARLRLAENSSLEVLAPPVAAAAEPSFLAALRAGAARFFGLRPTTTVIQTPNGTAASEHTEYEVRVLADGATRVTAFAGEVAFSNAGSTLSLDPAGIAAAVARPGEPPQPVGLVATNVVQWWIHHPAILDVQELELAAPQRAELEASLRAYAEGRLRAAVLLAPTNTPPASAGGRAYSAALRLVMNDVPAAEALLAGSAPDDPPAAALRTLIAAVRRDTNAPSAPDSASGWLAHSYLEQANHRLDAALGAAQQATELSPDFAAAWLRVAELQLGREDWRAARAALDRAAPLAPGSARRAVLGGFLLLAENRPARAEAAFDEAIAADASMADGWFGRGLARLRRHEIAAGFADLEMAVTLEPDRAELRARLGKALALEGRWAEAELQLARARKLDPRDPTPWLYAAVLDRELNRLNPAITNLAESVRLNDHRQLFRGRAQLDQDEAIRRANIAALFREAGLLEWSRWEAARAVSEDYANADTHQFLAQSYAALADPFRTSLRFESAAAGEYLISSLLAPVGAAQLSPTAAFTQPMQFFPARSAELFTAVSVRSPGGVLAAASQQGHLDRVAWALDYTFADLDRGEPNTDFREHIASLAVKQQVGVSDSAYLFVQGTTADGGDTRQYFNPADADPTYRQSEDQWPNALLGWQHQWSPGHQTLALAGVLHDEFGYSAGAQERLLVRTTNGVPRTPLRAFPFATQYEDDFRLWSFEVQQLARHRGGELQAGVRFQTGDLGTQATLQEVSGQQGGIFAEPASADDLDASVQRFSVYVYETLQVLERLRLTAGVAYDDLHFPENILAAPLDDRRREESAVSPKAGVLWTPWDGTAFRAVYTRSLGGFSFDSSVRLEPTQVLGFLQTYRSLFPESVTGSVPGAEFETVGFNASQVIGERVYATVVVEELRSDADRTFGAFRFEPPGVLPAEPMSLKQNLEFRETLVGASVNVLAGRDVALAARYNYAWSRLETGVPALASIEPSLAPAEHTAHTHEFNVTGLWRHPTGWFAQAAATWIWQENGGADAALGDEAVTQVDLVAGFRFPRRVATVSVGVLNVTDEDWRLNPLGFRAQLPRERTVVASVTFNVW